MRSGTGTRLSWRSSAPAQLSGFMQGNPVLAAVSLLQQSTRPPPVPRRFGPE